MINALKEAKIEDMPIASALESASTCSPGKTVNFPSSAEQAEQDASYMLPFPLDFKTTAATCMPAPEMDYPCDIKMWNKGNMDAWNIARDPG